MFENHEWPDRAGAWLRDRLASKADVESGMTYKIDTAGCRKALAAVGLGVVVGLVLFYLLIVKLSS